MNLKNMLRILYDDFDQKVKNIHYERDLYHSYKNKSVYGRATSNSEPIRQLIYNFCVRSRTYRRAEITI